MTEADIRLVERASSVRRVRRLSLPRGSIGDRISRGKSVYDGEITCPLCARRDLSADYSISRESGARIIFRHNLGMVVHEEENV